MKRIALLTSGGDTPAMNASIFSVVRTAKSMGLDVVGVLRGYAGLIEGRMEEMRTKQVENIVGKGGTILKTARCLEMLTDEGKKKAIDTLDAFRIDALIVVGGDCSFRGAQALTHLGVPAIGLPGTIDNDIAYTDYSIGFDTAINSANAEIAKIRDTMLSHDRIGVVEIMGRNCGTLALHVGIGSEADYIIVPEVDFDVDEICESILDRESRGKNTSIIAISEGAGSSEALAKYMNANTTKEVRSIVLGYVQRGGAPSAFDRTLAMRLGAKAVDLAVKGFGGKAVGIRNSQIVVDDIDDALSVPLEFDHTMYEQYAAMTNY
jgi:6-phosphofructokinase 1